MTELEIWKFMSNVGLVGTHAQFHKFSGGLHNSVWHVDTGYSSLVAKEYTTSTISPLFPNLPDKEAEALRRVTFENVWAYSANISVSRRPLQDVVLGEGSFSYLTPPFDPSIAILDQSEFNPGTLVKLENDALIRGSRAFFNILTTLGAKVDWVTNTH